MKLNSWPETGSDGDVLLTPCDPKGITGYDDDDDILLQFLEISSPVQQKTDRVALNFDETKLFFRHSLAIAKKFLLTRSRAIHYNDKSPFHKTHTHTHTQ